MEEALVYVYLADISQRIIDLSWGVLGLFVIGIFYYVTSCCIEDKKIDVKKIFKYAIPFTIPLFIGLTFPSESTLYSIAAVKAGKDIEVSETVQKTIDLINLKLDEALKEEKSEVK